MVKAPRVSAGSTRFFQSPRPEVGKRSALRDRSRMNKMPRKNVGADWPTRATPMAAWSRSELRFMAESSPMGSAIRVASTKAVRPSSSVAAR
jgi:hypothetical protein